ncbi:hypothetical protein [Shewanella algae]|uniref:hypothetical protein n=1 Tax=Shewanella algae TaxID=38313 RepID=UPI00313EE801
MSSIKEALFDREEQKMKEWIRSKLGDPFADEDSEGWDDLVEHYSDFQDALAAAAEQRWIEKQSLEDIYSRFHGEVLNLSSLMSSDMGIREYDLMCKMIYTHAVTLMEAYLFDLTKLMTLNNHKFFNNAITKINDLKNVKLSLAEVQELSNIKEFVISKISEFHFHNLNKVEKILYEITNTKLEIDTSELQLITKTRHDLVHRNGQTVDGKTLNLGKDSVFDTLRKIAIFIDEVNAWAHKVIDTINPLPKL